MLYVDDRRIGDHGIGRFARQVLAGLDYCAVSLKTDPDSPLDPVRLTRALGKLKTGDLFFSPGYNPPIRCPAPFLFTLHDLNHLDREENSSPLKRLYYALIVKRACHRAARVVTVSEFSRRRIIEWSGVVPEKVVNVGNGVGTEFNPNVTPYRFPYPYILCVTNRQKHKNEFRQVEAFAKAGLDNKFILAFTGEPTAALTDCINRHGLSAQVHFLGTVPDAQLPSLYRGAEAMLFASLYEGFGLPVIEAMACGTPVVTSNTTALPETAGDAALLVDPTSVEQISHALLRIIRDFSLRRRLRDAGVDRARQFSWANTTSKVRSLLAANLLQSAEGEPRENITIA